MAYLKPFIRPPLQPVSNVHRVHMPRSMARVATSGQSCVVRLSTSACVLSWKQGMTASAEVVGYRCKTSHNHLFISPKKRKSLIGILK